MLIRNKASRLVIVFFVLLSTSCAASLEKQSRLAARNPVYITGEDRAAYAFSLAFIRQLERRGGKIVKEATRARSHISIKGPQCRRTALFINEEGRRTDYRINCLLYYDIRIRGEDLMKSGVLSSSDYLIQTSLLSAYYRNEEQLFNKLSARLAQQLIRALATIS